MTLYTYKLLSKLQRYDILRNQGVFVAERAETKYKFLLYQIDSFYVELKYHRSSHRIIRIKAFEKTRLLEPYLKDNRIKRNF